MDTKNELNNDVLTKVSGGTDVPSMKAVISEKCLFCGTCVEYCYREAIIYVNDMFKVDPEICNGCGACINECPLGAITLV